MEVKLSPGLSVGPLELQVSLPIMLLSGHLLIILLVIGTNWCLVMGLLLCQELKQEDTSIVLYKDEEEEPEVLFMDPVNQVKSKAQSMDIKESDFCKKNIYIYLIM